MSPPRRDEAALAGAASPKRELLNSSGHQDTPGVRQIANGAGGAHSLRVLARIRDTRLSPVAVATGAMIVSHFNRDGAAWPDLTTLAADTGLDRRTVRRAVAELEAAGILRVGCRCGKPAAECEWRGRSHGPLFTAADAPAPEPHPERTKSAPNGAKKYTGGTSRSTPGYLHTAPPLTNPPPLKVQREGARAGARRTGHEEINEVDKVRSLRKAVGREWADLALEEVDAREAHGLPVFSRWALARELAECYAGRCRNPAHSELHGPAAVAYHAARRKDWAQEAQAAEHRRRGPTATLPEDDYAEVAAERRRQLDALEASAPPDPALAAHRRELRDLHSGMFPSAREGQARIAAAAVAEWKLSGCNPFDEPSGAWPGILSRLGYVERQEVAARVAAAVDTYRGQAAASPPSS